MKAWGFGLAMLSLGACGNQSVQTDLAIADAAIAACVQNGACSPNNPSDGVERLQGINWAQLSQCGRALTFVEEYTGRDGRGFIYRCSHRTSTGEYIAFVPRDPHPDFGASFVRYAYVGSGNDPGVGSVAVRLESLSY